MVSRVTTAQRFSVALQAIQSTQSKVLDIQKQIVTGKRVQKPSDDPGSFSKILNLRRIIADSNQFTRNIRRTTAFANITDASLQSIRNLLVQARGIAIGQAGSPADELTRAGSAVQVDRIRESIIQIANTQVGRRFIFSGSKIFTPAYSKTGEFQGDQGELKINVGLNNASAVNIVGSKFLTTDLDPDLFITTSNLKSTAAVTSEFILNGTNNVLRIQEKEASVASTNSVTLSTGTLSGTALATRATLEINNQIKVVTSSNNTIKILENGGTVSDTITLTAGVKAGTALATELQTALNASGTLNGTYTVTYDLPTDKFTVLVAGGPTSVGVDVTSGTDLAKLIGFTQEATFSGLATTSDEALTGTTVSYDEATDRFTVSRSGSGDPKFQILSAGTDAASTAANIFGFTADSLESTTAISATATAFNIITGTNNIFSVQVDGGTSTAITIGSGVFTGENLASKIELAINNSVKEVTASNNTIKILEDGGVRSETFSLPTTGTKSGATIATELQNLLNASTTLKGSTASGATTGYVVSYDLPTDKFKITSDAPAVSVGVDVSKGDDLAALMGFTKDSPFGKSATSDTAITGARVDYDASFKDSFTVTSPRTGASSSIVLTPGGTDILGTLNLTGATLTTSKSTALSDLNAGKGVSSGSISITNRAGAKFTVDLSTAVNLTDVITKIEAVATGVKVTVGADGKRLILTDTNSPPVSNLIVEEVGTTTTAFDLGIKANIPGNITGLDVDPRVSNDTPTAALRDGSGVRLGTVKIANAEIDLDLGSKTVVNDLLQAITTNSSAAAVASISADGKSLKISSTDKNTAALVIDVSGNSVKDLGFQGANDVIGLLDVLEEALLRNDADTIGRTLDEFTLALERISQQQVIVGETVRQFERITQQQESIILAFGEVLTKEEDVDLTQAITEFSVFQTSLEAAFASTAQILRVTLLDFLR